MIYILSLHNTISLPGLEAQALALSSKNRETFILNADITVEVIGENISVSLLASVACAAGTTLASKATEH